MKQTRLGLILGISAYTIWGAFPFYFTLIAEVDPLEAVSWRVFTTLLFTLVLVSFTKKWRQLGGVLKNRKKFWWLVLSSLLLFFNWQFFVIGVMSGHVLETSLGYFINPIVTILIGVIVRKETLTRLQWLAVIISAIGVLVVAFAYGSVPWIALFLAFSFGFYGAVRKQVGDGVDGITGLTVESMIAAPVALVQLLIVWQMSGLTLHHQNALVITLVLLSGVITAVPLILFGEAARRLPLSYLGFVQFLTPILSFSYGYFVAGEEMSAMRWFGFGVVWVALMVLISDMIIQAKQTPKFDVAAELAAKD